MKLITEKIKDRMPRLEGTRKIPRPDRFVQAKFFTPWTDWTWYVVEAGCLTHDDEYVALRDMQNANALDILFYGVIEYHVIGWGYFTLHELKSITGPHGAKVQRDMHIDRPTIGMLFPRMKG